MKNKISQIIGLMFVFSVALLSAHVSKGNILFSLMSIPVAAYAFQVYTGVSFDVRTGLCTLVSIPKLPCGTNNTPGIKKLFIISADKIEGGWPKKVDVTAGEITTAPTFVSGATFVEVGITPKTTKVDSALKGPTRHQVWEHMLEGKVAGYTKEQCDAIEKLLNSEGVAIAVNAEGVRSVVGSSSLGLEFEISHTSGAGGSDRREWTIKAKNEGYSMGILPLAASVTIPGVVAA